MASDICQALLSGLDRGQVKAAVSKLLDMGPTARTTFYKSWFEHSSSEMTAEERGGLDRVEKIDLSNEAGPCRCLFATPWHAVLPQETRV
jgi:hypothetical protein